MSVDRGLRLAGTAISFATFGIGGLFLALFVFPVVSLQSREPEQRHRRARRIISASFRLFLALMYRLRVLDLELHDLDTLRAQRGTLVVANHPSLIDIILLLAHIDQGTCVVKQALWHNPFLGGVVRAAGYISNKDNVAMIDDCARALRRGETLVVFPEGTRTEPGQPLNLRRGAAAIALRSGAEVRLVHIRCHPTTLTKSEHWYEIPPRRPCFSLRVGDNLDVGEYLALDLPASVTARRLTAVLQQELTKDVFADARA